MFLASGGAQAGGKLRTGRRKGNRLISLPPEIGALSSLQTLLFGSNQLSSLPLDIGALGSLQTLDLRDNQLSSLPERICLIPGLKAKPYSDLDEFSLSRNPLTHLPDCYLDKFSQEELLEWAAECLGGSLYHVAYQTVDNLMRRFPETAAAEREKLLAQVRELEAAGVKEEDMEKIKALLGE